MLTLSPALEAEPLSLDEVVFRAERTAVKAALFWSSGCVTRAAAALGRNRTELYRIMQRVDVNPRDYKGLR